MEVEDDSPIPKLELDGPIPIPTAGDALLLAVGGVAEEADSVEAISLTVSPLNRSEVPDCTMEGYSNYVYIKLCVHNCTFTGILHV